MRTLLLSVVLATTLTGVAKAGFQLEIDFDPGTAGIQNTVFANPGDTITGSVLLTLDGGDIMRGYEYNLAYDSAELGSAVVTRQTVFASPFFPDDGTDSGSSWGLLRSTGQNSSDTIGPGVTVELATFSFVAITPADDANFDLSFTGVQVNDNSGALSGTASGGFVAVPEPSSMAVLGLTLGGLMVRRRRKA